MRELVAVYGLPILVTSATVAVALGLCALLGVWTEHTDASRVLAADVSDGLTAAGKHNQLAESVIGMSAPKLSRALNLGEPLNLWRMAALPDAFWLAFIERVAARLGAVVIRPQQVAVFYGAAELGKKRMARMGIGSGAERRLA